MQTCAGCRLGAAGDIGPCLATKFRKSFNNRHLLEQSISLLKGREKEGVKFLAGTLIKEKALVGAFPADCENFAKFRWQH